MRAAPWIAALVISTWCTAENAFAVDWPNWLGPNRNGSSPETGLLTKWPKEGPKVLWKVPGGDGYSAVAVADGRAITLVQHDDKEWCLALDAVKGTKLWEKEISSAYKNQYGNGPRSTPAIDGSLVYAQSVTGPFVCLEAGSGKIVWKVDVLKDFGVKNLTWGLSASPLVEGNLVYAIPGAPGAGVVAFKKTNGDVAWKSGSDKAAYASPAIAVVGGKKQLIVFNAEALEGMDAESGKELWRIPWKTEFDVNICTPLIIDDLMFVASGEHVGSTMFQFKDGKPVVLWESKGKKDQVMTTYWANAVHQDGYLYGLSGEFDKRIDLNCVELKTGKLMWSRKDFGKGAITLADKHLWMTTKKGDLVLAHANPKDYMEDARVPNFLGENRTVPTIANGRLYLRDLQQVYCLDIRP
jgi:outer membrane protein assembly factor BamB